MTRITISSVELKSKVQIDQLSVFFILLCVAAFNENIVFMDRIYGAVGLFWWLQPILALLTIFWAGSIYCFVVLLIAHVVQEFCLAPAWANHELWSFILAISLLIGLLPTIARSYLDGTPIDRKHLNDTLRPLAMAQLLIVYFLAAFHKTNWDFLKPSVSCGATMLADLSQTLGPLIPTGEIASRFSIGATLFAEWSLPFLFLFRKTRAFALMLAIVIHIIWCAHPNLRIFDFSIWTLAVLSLMVPEFLQSSQGKEKSELFLKIFAGLLMAILVLGYYSAHVGSWKYDADFLVHESPFKPFLIYWRFAIIVFGFYMLYQAVLSTPAIEKLKLEFSSKNATQLITVSILLFLGVGPYLGLRTVPAFGMFSNLRTHKAQWNHILVPASAKVFDYEEDLAQITATTDPLVALSIHGASKKGRAETNYMPVAGAIALASVYDGETQIIKNGKKMKLVNHDGILKLNDEVIEPNLWQRKFMSFRSLTFVEDQICRP